MKQVIIMSVFLLAALILAGCQPEEESNDLKIPTVNETVVEDDSSGLVEISQVENISQSWCNPSSETYGTMVFETIGLQENYIIEGKAYTVCEEKIIDSGKLNSHKWRTQDNKVIKESRLDTDDKYGLTTNWVNEAGQKCVRVEKEGVDPFLQCR
ncbi:TPA: hypothetical protein HA241_00755 [Candidatus Woesearchaeota archaeon]|nr:hypothetical protein [Candidatus Woesearchaeota archaeon]